MFTKEQQRLAAKLCKRIQLASANSHIPKDMDLKKECGVHYKTFIKSSSTGVLTFKSLNLIASNTVCLHCKKKIPDMYGQGTSLCLACRQNKKVDVAFYKRLSSQTTCLKKYGVKNPFQSEEIMEIAKATNLRLYGDVNPAGAHSILRPAMNKRLRENVETMVASTRANAEAKYGKGITHWMQAPGSRERFAKKIEERYGKGITNPMLEPGNKARFDKRMRDLKNEGFWKEVYETKVVPAIRDKYGIDNIWEDLEYMKAKRLAATGYEFPLQDPKSRKNFRKTSMENYGVGHHMQDPETYARIMSSHKDAHFYECTYGKQVYSVIGTYEIFILRYLLSKYRSTNVKSGFDVPSIKLIPNRRTYYPDFFLRDENIYVECKSSYTLLGIAQKGYSLWKSNKLKAKRCIELGIDLIWVLPNVKAGTILQLPKDWYTWPRSKLIRFLKETPGRQVSLTPEGRFQSRRLYIKD